MVKSPGTGEQQIEGCLLPSGDDESRDDDSVGSGMNLQDVVLKPGDRAQATGEIIERDGDFGLLLVPNVASYMGRVELDWAATVRLTASPATDWLGWESRLGDSVAVRGLWTGQALELDGASQIETVIQPSNAAALPAPPQAADRMELLPVDAEIAKASKMLRDNDALVSLHIPSTRSGDHMVYATAIDVELVRSTFEPIFGHRLVVIASRWNNATIRGLRDIIVDAPAEILSSFGTRNSPDHQELLTATIKYLPEQFARQLEPYPAEALDLTVLIRPA